MSKPVTKIILPKEILNALIRKAQDSFPHLNDINAVHELLIKENSSFGSIDKVRYILNKKTPYGATTDTRELIGKVMGYDGWIAFIKDRFPDKNDMLDPSRTTLSETKTQVYQTNNNYLEKEIRDKAKQLQTLYEKDEILIGVEQANQAYSEYGAHPKILRHFIRFNMRLNRWQKIDSEVEKILKSKPDDKVFTLCKLATVERKLRDAYSNNHPSNNSKREDKINSAQRDLDSIPHTQHSNNKEYWYWQGRWHLEWWHYNIGVNNSDLKLALRHFEDALKIKSTWFVLFYKCVVLKLLRGKLHRSFKEALVEFTTDIMERENRSKMASVRTYRISSFLLNENIEGLQSFLKEIDSVSSATDFSSTMKHHLELIFFGDISNFNVYNLILNEWDANH